MAKNKIMDATKVITDTLEPLESEERTRAIRAALTILGDKNIPNNSPPSGNGGGGGNGNTDVSMTAKAYFELKEPKNKGEDFATAARYREKYNNAETSTKADLEEMIKKARRNFDGNNFTRDIDNARAKGLFNKGTGKDSAVLSHYGQNYVDAMPDREAVKKLKKPTKKKTARKKKASRKKAGKK